VKIKDILGVIALILLLGGYALILLNLHRWCVLLKRRFQTIYRKRYQNKKTASMIITGDNIQLGQSNLSTRMAAVIRTTIARVDAKITSSALRFFRFLVRILVHYRLTRNDASTKNEPNRRLLP
jgi:hypothetical protein